MTENVINFLRYLKIEKNYSNNTIINYAKDLKLFVSFLEIKKITKIANIEYKTIRQFLNFLYEEEYSKKSIARYISTLRSFFKYLIKENIIKKNPMTLVSNPKLDKRLPKFLYYEQLEKILSIPDKETPFGMRDLTLLETFYSTGIRVSEIINIKISDIDFDQFQIKILGKGNKERIVLYGKVLAGYLNDYLVKRVAIAKDNDYLFVNRYGNKLTDRGVRKIIDNILKKGMLEFHISPHVLRHTFATHLLNNGADLKTVQELLGHDSLASTQVYTQVTDEHIREVYTQARKNRN